jgi:signal transduction histidine kinase
VLVVGILATFQYHWIGQLSTAERERLQKSLGSQADDFADAFDAELLWIEVAFQAGGAVGPDAAEPFARAYDAWREKARFPQIVRSVYLVDAAGKDVPIRQYHPDQRRFVAVEWPAELTEVRSRLVQSHKVMAADRVLAGQRLPKESTVVLLREPIVPSVPALVVSLPAVDQTHVPAPPGGFSLRLGSSYLVVHLDRDAIRSSILPALAAEYFAGREADAYRIAIVDAQDRSNVVFSRGSEPGGHLDPRHADATVPLFALRFALNGRIAPRMGRPPGSTPASAGPALPLSHATGPGPGAAGTVAIYVESRTVPKGDVLRVSARPPGGAGWELLLQHPAGSLDAAVAAARRRNLWISFGILAVLAVGVALVVINAQRSERLAAQQMDFVATVSHELRTPLAVIRSAAQNLSAGVVHDPQKTRYYGELIELEGRRLTDMVERVLEYAGLAGARRPATARPLDPARLVNDAINSWTCTLDLQHVDVTLDVANPLPPVHADEQALGRALDNLIANALKHGADGRWIGVSAHRARARGQDEVQIAVSDRGHGIDTDGLAHLFEPFYRGREAVERQVPGSGLGLSLVKRIAEVHGGRVSVTSTPGQGATFTIHLPAAAPDPALETTPEGVAADAHRV